VGDGRPGLVVRTPDAVQAGVYMGVFPLAFTSSVFGPVQTMPRLQAFATNQPVTVATNALPGLILGQGAWRLGGPSPARCCALAWSAAMIAVFAHWRCACTAARAFDPTIPRVERRRRGTLQNPNAAGQSVWGTLGSWGRGTC
jgi:hypothetical protein